MSDQTGYSGRRAEIARLREHNKTLEAVVSRLTRQRNEAHAELAGAREVLLAVQAWMGTDEPSGVDIIEPGGNWIEAGCPGLSEGS